ncbi:MAG: hypothetical protein KJI70_02790 [Patescibacteria group bacterium]|nr:hypothetical protein [Patescibacteria group bacterium]
MKKLKIIRFEELKAIIKKLPKKLAEKAFLSFLGLFILSMIFGMLIFYRYRVEPEETIPETSKVGLQFKSDLYQQVLEIWQNTEQKFEKTDTKQYPNLFVR